jgi:predicted dehydrogenase
MSSSPAARTKAPQVAIIGAGLMGRWHLRAAHRAGARVVLVVDRDIAAARRLAGRARGCRAAEAFDTNAGIDAVHLCTPVETHLALGRQILQAGAHLLAEKPLAANTAEVDDLLAAATAADRYVCPVHQYAFQHPIASGAARQGLGRLRRIDIDIRTAGAVGAFAGRDDAVIGEILPHAISLLQTLLETPDLQPATWQVEHGGPGEALFTAMIGGALVSVSISTHARPTAFLLRLSGDQGAAEVDAFHGYAVKLGGAVSRLRKIVGPFERNGLGLVHATGNLLSRTFAGEMAYPGLQNLVGAFYAHIWRGAPAPISFEAMRQGALARDVLLQRLAPSVSGEPARG